MRTMQGWITELMVLYDQDQPTKGTLPSVEVRELRIALVQEEIQETIDAMLAEDLVEVADGLADVLVVTLGTHNACGLVATPGYTGCLPEHPPRLADHAMVKVRIEMLRNAASYFTETLKENSLEYIRFACNEIVNLANETAILYGIDILPVFMEVHWSNKTKFGEDGKPIKREDGKVIKGPNYQKPDIAAVLELQKKYYIHSECPLNG